MTTNLSRTDTRHRSARVNISSYQVEIDLSESADHHRATFPTRSTIVLASREPETFLDFVGASVDEVLVNGEARQVEYDGARIRVTGLRTCADPSATIPVDRRPDVADEQVAAALNTITVCGQARYSRSGEGLHRYVDPADGNTYLYTQFEPSDARLVFANCEQPDLKAIFEVTVTAPAEWEVLGNQPEVSREDAGTSSGGQALVRCRFAPTPPLSTYLVCVAAGPYRRWSDSWTGTVRDQATGEESTLTVPLSVFCRRSLAESFDPENVLKVTRQGLDYFHELFRSPYPWGKYDSIFVPEYNLGAMENPGLVTFSDGAYVFQSGSTRADHEQRANTILHEMSHMWFGDLVTPQWWDDLWLKESFADYMGTAANAEATEFTEAWTAFCARRKGWAYRADQLPTTHPIVADIPDVEAAEQNFDGITYAKGAAVVKQLIAYVGQEAFRAAIRAYFAEHAYGSTSLPDVLAVLEEHSGRDLKSWSTMWLETTGMSTLTPRVEVDGEGRVVELSITQEGHDLVSGGPVVRPHRLVVGVYDREGDGLCRTDRIELDLVEEVTSVPQVVGRPLPDLIVVNDDDLTYAKARLDERSRETALTSLTSISSSLTRACLWAALWNDCRDGLLPAARFVSFVMDQAPTEPDVALVTTALQRAVDAANSFVPRPARAAAVASIVETAWQRLQDGSSGPDHQLAWARVFASASLSCDARAVEIRELLDGHRQVPGLAVGPQLRWQWWRALAATGHAGEVELADERQRDVTSAAPVRHRLAVASMPTAHAKRSAWEAVVEDDRLTNEELTACATGFSTPGQEWLREDYAGPYFAMLSELWASRSMELADRAVIGLFPDTGDLQVGVPPEEHRLPVAGATWLAEHPDAPGALRRRVSELTDEAMWSLRVQAGSALS
ncbi:aminopeptidase G. Metallo peptidase. MEROPS family M01 [Austwickia chelonae]|uniref:aminopeptidase N n=1 Tax=Austwickia chelonae TaxID=100225 RepID=UPI00030F0439|nr:aminopeptidase N [Austwickia chelonae]SEW35420.1 aminopeptidase G. Metallo peptidase. MEROPS family M01 [Austwickia chelonae]